MMMARTHLKAGFLTAIATNQLLFQGQVIYEPNIVVFYSATLIGSVLPDIDHPKSFIGRRIPFLPTILDKTVGHRTLTHSLVFLVSLIIVWFLSNNLFLRISMFGLFLGSTSHILLDMITMKGVALLYPFSKKKYGLGIMKTNSKLETIFGLVLFVLIVLMLNK